jgi:hypothetical protein
MFGFWSLIKVFGVRQKIDTKFGKVSHGVTACSC